MYTVGERLLLRKCMVLRRIQSDRGVPLDLLLQGINDDERLLRERSPEMSIQTGDEPINCVRECEDDGMLRPYPGAGGQHYIRTALGDTFMRTLEPRLSEALDNMPMSAKGLLDFMARS